MRSRPLPGATRANWLKIVALAFAMGVVSGLVISYRFGTNSSVFSDRAGPVIGPLMHADALRSVPNEEDRKTLRGRADRFSSVVASRRRAEADNTGSV